LGTEKITVPLPINLKDTEFSRFAPFQTYEFEKISLIPLSNVWVTRSGIVMKNFRLIVKSVYAYKDRHAKYWKSVLLNLLFRKKERTSKSETFTIAQNYYCPGYYHWLTEALPRIIALGEKRSDLVLILPDYTEPYIEKSLEIFRFKSIQKIIPKTILFVNHLLLPSHPRLGDTFDPNLFNQMRSLYFEYIKTKHPSNSAYGERIYASRKKARARKISNESEVSELLTSKGFQEVHFEDISFFEQVAIMSKATHLVSIHGAGLTNMIFMPRNGYVMEFYRQFVSQDEFHSKSYWRLAGTVGLNYLYQLCETKETPKAFDTDDLLVDINALKDNLRIMGIN